MQGMKYIEIPYVKNKVSRIFYGTAMPPFFMGGYGEGTWDRGIDAGSGGTQPDRRPDTGADSRTACRVLSSGHSLCQDVGNSCCSGGYAGLSSGAVQNGGCKSGAG